MKKILTFMSTLLLSCTLLAGCSKNLNPTNYLINSDGNLIVTYSDGSTENLGPLGSTLVNGVETISISEDGYYVINGVETDIVAKVSYEVSFNTGCSLNVPNQNILEGNKVIRPEISRTGYTLDGWYCNGEEWRFNSDIVLNDMELEAEWTANQYLISFDTNGEYEVEDLLVTYDEPYTLPSLTKVGHDFLGWYNGSKKVSSGSSWNIADNITLTAKWDASEYIITLDPNGGNVSQATKKVTYGEMYNLPVPTNDFGQFKGWYYNQEKITDEYGNSLEAWMFDENITVKTTWITEIYTVEDLLAIKDGLNGYYKLFTDIDLTDVKWVPIGSTSSPFTGILDGNGFKISNLSISEANCSEIGLFGCSSGTIKNIVLDNVNIDLGAIVSDSYVAALVANNKGKIEDVVTLSGKVTIANHSATLTSCVSGITAKNSGSLNNLINNLNVKGGIYTGGICAYDESSTANNITRQRLVNNGVIEGLQIAGGIYGYSNQKIFSYMKNTGSVTSINNAGGIVGVNTAKINNPIEFKYCVNTASINSTDSNFSTSYAGGLTSIAYEVCISDSYNTGMIIGYHRGGLVGYNIGNGSYVRCLNTASCGYGFSNYIGGSFIYDSIDYGTNTFATGYATVTNSYHEKPTNKNFYIETLFWSEEVWNFSGTGHPILNWESEIKN